MLSEFRHFAVLDRDGKRAGVSDVQVDLAAADYPRATALVIRRRGSARVHLDWSAVHDIDGRAGCIQVDRLDGRPITDARAEHGVFLVRDVLDALVIDVARRETTRANDLWLEWSDGAIWLRAADLSPWAIIRRLARGRLGRGAPSDLLDWKYVEFLRGDPDSVRAGGDYHRRITTLTPATIARLAAALPFIHAAELLILLDDDLAARALEEMRPDRQLQVFEALEARQGVRLVAHMAPDLAADLVGHLHLERARQVLAELPKERADAILDLLQYAEDVAGGIMTNDVLFVPRTLTARAARARLREALAEPDFVYYVYVVNDDLNRKLQGMVTLRDLLLVDHEPVEKIMRPCPSMISPLTRADDAARRLADEGLLALPVVENDGRLLGAITIDAAVGRLAPERWRGLAPRVFS